MNKYPENTSSALTWDKLFRHETEIEIFNTAAAKMVPIADKLPDAEYIGIQYEVPTEGITRISAFGSPAVKASDLEWISEGTAKTDIVKDLDDTMYRGIGTVNWELYEIKLPVKKQESTNYIGFGAVPEIQMPDTFSTLHNIWPIQYKPLQFGELITALRSEGAFFRYTIGKATIEEQRACEKMVISTWNYSTNPAEYIGAPVRAKVLLMLPTPPSIRLRTVIGEAVSGAALVQIGNMSETDCQQVWQNPMSKPQILPAYAAKILALEPIVGKKPIISIETCPRDAKPIPAAHEDSTDTNSIPIGIAMGTDGLIKQISLGSADLKRHTQIIGQTGTGKSTAAQKMIHGAIEKGLGVTLFDPHGTTVNYILRTLPKKYADRVDVIRIGDELNPVPASPWVSGNPADNEKVISDMFLLFQEIFDPKQKGFLGPRWERWFSIFAKAAIAMLGRNASFESIVALSQNKENMKKLVTVIKFQYPDIANAITDEYIMDNGIDFAALIGWCVSKFQRLTSVPQLRNTLGAGANAIDFKSTIDTNRVTLIDLASPAIGTHAARVIGTLILQQLWDAFLTRENRDVPHLVVIDEAHLFQTNPLPQMLAEGRKFGVALALAHQHCGQLSHNVRDTLDANSANLIAFKLSVHDAAEVTYRFEDTSIGNELCRLNAFNAIATLSIDGKQTPAFTLMIEKPQTTSYGEKLAKNIEQRSITRLVEPYRDCRALTQSEILEKLDYRYKHPASAKRTASTFHRLISMKEPAHFYSKQPPVKQTSDFISRLQDISQNTTVKSDV